MNSQSLRTEVASVEILQRVHRRLVVLQVARPLEALLAEPALMLLRHLVDVLDVLLQRVQVWRLLAAVGASVVQVLRPVVLHVPIVGFQVGEVMSANLAPDAILRPSRVRLHVLVDGVLRAECLRADFADFHVGHRVGVVLEVKGSCKLR